MATESRLDDADRAEVRAIAGRLREAVEKAGGNKRVAERAGVPLRTLNGYMAAEADPKITKLHRLAEACSVTVDQLLGGKLPPDGAGNGMRTGELIPLEDFVPIRRLEIRASAGGGRAVIPGDEAEAAVAFRRSWLRSLGVTPGNAEFMEAMGDSMDPTIKDKDLMLLDRGYGEVVNGKIYVLVRGDLVLVKRLQVLAFGGLMLISDNERYPAETIPQSEVDSLNIAARVAWYGRAM